MHSPNSGNEVGFGGIPPEVLSSLHYKTILKNHYGIMLQMIMHDLVNGVVNPVLCFSFSVMVPVSDSSIGARIF